MAGKSRCFYILGSLWALLSVAFCLVLRAVLPQSPGVHHQEAIGGRTGERSVLGRWDIASLADLCSTMNKHLQAYLNAYSGLSRPSWMLALVMLINRTGAMVLPFLGVYMTTALDYSLKQAGWVLSCFGLGSVVGSAAGGWLTDRYGHFRTQLGSLVLAVPAFVALSFVTDPVALAGGVFLLSTITDIFRPANSVSLSAYVQPQNITRAFSLNRMAINLGFSVGPALGGLLAAVSYHLLFYGNALSAAAAGLVFYSYFRQKERARMAAVNAPAPRKIGASPWRDRPFVLFSLLRCCYGISFFPLLGTLPIFYKEVARLSDWQIGLLLGFNGLVVFALEMILVRYSERRWRMARIVVMGTVLCGLGYLTLLLYHHVIVLYLSMFMLSLSEILFMPFTSTIAIKRAPEGRQGAYMGMNAMSFSLATILAPYLGTQMASHFGFDRLWWATAALALCTALALSWNMRKMT